MFQKVSKHHDKKNIAIMYNITSQTVFLAINQPLKIYFPKNYWADTSSWYWKQLWGCFLLDDLPRLSESNASIFETGIHRSNPVFQGVHKMGGKEGPFKLFLLEGGRTAISTQAGAWAVSFLFPPHHLGLFFHNCGKAIVMFHRHHHWCSITPSTVISGRQKGHSYPYGYGRTRLTLNMAKHVCDEMPAWRRGADAGRTVALLWKSGSTFSQGPPSP